MNRFNVQCKSYDVPNMSFLDRLIDSSVAPKQNVQLKLVAPQRISLDGGQYCDFLVRLQGNRSN